MTTEAVRLPSPCASPAGRNILVPAVTSHAPFDGPRNDYRERTGQKPPSHPGRHAFLPAPIPSRPTSVIKATDVAIPNFDVFSTVTAPCPRGVSAGTHGAPVTGPAATVRENSRCEQGRRGLQAGPVELAQLLPKEAPLRSRVFALGDQAVEAAGELALFQESLIAEIRDGEVALRLDEVLPAGCVRR